MAILWQTSDPIATTDFSNGTGLVQNTGNVELSPVNAAASGRDGSATSENVRYGYIRFRFDDLPENRVEFFGFGYGYQRAYLTIDENGSVDIRGHNAGDIDTGMMTVVEGVTYDVEMYFNLDMDEYEVRNGSSTISSGSHTQGGSLRSFFVGNGSLNGSLDTTVTYDLKVFQVIIDDSEFPFTGSTGPEMSGSADIELAVSGSMLFSGPMSSSVPIELGLSGRVLVSEPMTGDVRIEMAAAGSMQVSDPMSGAWGIEVAVSGAMLTLPPMSGNVVVDIETDGGLSVVTATGTVYIGKICCGRMVNVGSTQWNIEKGIIDYSKNITDDFGESYRKEGKYAPQIKGSARVSDVVEVDQIDRLLTEVRATDCVWDFNENDFDLSVMIAYGLVAEYKIRLINHNDTIITFRIDGAV